MFYKNLIKLTVNILMLNFLIVKNYPGVFNLLLAFSLFLHSLKNNVLCLKK